MHIRLYRAQRRRIERMAKKERDAYARQRCRIVLALDRAIAKLTIHETLGAARSTINRVEARFQQCGEDCLPGRRHLVAPRKVTDFYLQLLKHLIWKVPKDFGWQRSTWTTELLSRQLAQDTGIVVHRSHLGRWLRRLDMRWGRPRPVPLRYTTKAVKTRKANAVKREIADLPKDEVAVYEDEVDIHLNPKIGPCWMPRGVQFEVETPGKNEKRYIFGGLNPRSGHLVWLSSARKNSEVFIAWLTLLCRSYRRYRLIHVVCDNYIIHKSKKTQRAVAKLGKVRLHFLPPYSPEHSPIERLWGDLHANVTRNHKHRTMDALMEDVGGYLARVVPYPGARPALTQVMAM